MKCRECEREIPDGEGFYIETDRDGWPKINGKRLCRECAGKDGKEPNTAV